jgi:putative FmdB family regulatory protein
MPLYEYRCTKCGERLEVLQHLSDARLAECPRCGGALEKVISAPALQFKGSGWYVTDYARNGKSPSTNGSGTDSKPHEKTASEKSKAEAPKSDAPKAGK